MSERESFGGGALTGLSVRGDREDLPLLVMIPGGGGQAFIFDIPGRSFLETARVNGFSALAFNRPGQADSAPLPVPRDADSGIFAANAEALLGAIDEAWSRAGGNRPGVVIYGSSIGGAMSLHMAAAWSKAPREWPLLGVSVADIGQVPPARVVSTWRALPLEDTIDLAAYAHLFFGEVPAWTVVPPPTGAPPPRLLIPRAELQEVVGGWTRDWKAVAGGIRVPVQYALAEFDSVWMVDDALIGEFRDALASSSPYVDARMVPDTSHAIGMGSLAGSHFLDVLAFARRCETMRRHPEMLDPAITAR